MPYPSKTTYPTLATNASWQKKKSLLDKTVKTGVGPALVNAQSKWSLIKFTDLRVPSKWSTLEAAESALTKGKAAWKTVVAARTALKSAVTVTTTQSNNKKLSSASRTALRNIVTALKEADDRLDKMDDILPSLMVDVNVTKKAYAEAQRRQQQRAAEARKSLTNVTVKMGSTLVYSGGRGKLGSDKTYLVQGGSLHINFNLALSSLQKPVSVTAKDGLGQAFSENMTLAGVRGDDVVRLK